MPQNNTIIKELQEDCPTLASIGNENLFKAPQGYFERLPEAILNLAKAEKDAESIVITAGNENVFQVPNGYFDSLSDHILASIRKTEDISDSSSEMEFPVLDSLQKINVFTIPEEYFESLPHTILSKVAADKKPAKVVSFEVRKAWKYLAAAVVTGLVLISSFFMLNSSNPTSPELKIANQYKTSEQFSNGIASLSDDEIIGYLEDHGTIMDNDLLIKDTETEALPSPADYFLNDNALNEYLNRVGNN